MAQDQFMARPAASLTPQDRWLQLQLETLKKYFEIAQRHQALKRQQQKKDGGADSGVGQTLPDPVLDEMLALTGGLPAHIGPDPHTLGSKHYRSVLMSTQHCTYDLFFVQGRRRKKTREEFQHELFLRKRSRKNIRNVRSDSFEIDALEVDSDFSSGDECFFVNNPKGKYST